MLGMLSVVVTSPAEAARGQCGGQRATITGGAGSDVLIGTPFRDVIIGRQGRDTIIGGGGPDIICGRHGEDIVNGGRGNDVSFGNRNEDRCINVDRGASCGTQVGGV
jgi:Ca2+-binding RTX toxin-like protein